MKCVAPQLFRNRKSREYLLAPCERWSCPACGRMLAARWRAVLQWASERGQAPQYLLTLTLRNVLPLWREAPVSDHAQQKATATALARFLTTALTRLVAEIRQQFGPFEYVAFVELTTGRRTPGHRPHLHLLVRGRRLSSAWMSRHRPGRHGDWRQGDRLRSQFGRRELMALFHRIASTQLVVHARTGAPRNPEAKAYFEKRLGDQVGLPKSKQDRKVRKKALLSLMRQQVIRFFKLMKAQKVAAMEQRTAQEDAGAA